jgi:ubiquitin conjugation factor E4 B
MVNTQSVLLRFAEPFIDATYSKIDRIDPLFYSASDRIDIKEETRIKATAEEAAKWDEEHRAKPGGPPPNFITNIFYLTISMAHYGYLKSVDTYLNLQKHSDDIERQMQLYENDSTWRQSPFSVRIQRAIDNMKNDINKIKIEQFAYDTGLRDPELIFRLIGFINFLSSWVIRQVDPKKQHPTVHAELPLPTEVPMAFRVLPEYIVEDIVDFYHFIVQTSPESMQLTGKQELVSFALTFLTSTWYIKNPFLKSKINEALFMGIWPTRGERNGILGNVLNTNSLALKHLMPALMHFYIEVEQTGASSQFYDKFNARRSIAYILKVIWDNPTHREALKHEAKNVDKFVKFANLMINDVTYLLDESLSEMAQIHAIQVEMDDKDTWESKPQEYRREREGNLRSLERHASSYTTLGKSTVELLKLFTAETKAPFMMPEIVDRLAAMLDYNLDALAGPKCNDLHVRDPDKLKFDPRGLLKDILAVFLNLSDQKEFVHAVAGDGRSYRKELFERAAGIARRRSLMPTGEIEKLMLFVETVEEAKTTMEAEEDIGDIPDEYLDSLMFSIMRDPVMLPSSKAIVDRATIKSHLLSDSKDPFNRAPLNIEEVVPQVELKAKIDSFLAERREKLRTEKEAKMDVS